MAEHGLLLVLIIGIEIIGLPVNGESLTQNIDASNQKIFDCLDALERNVAEHPSQLEALRKEFKSEIDNIRQSHAEEMTNLREELNAEMLILKQTNEACMELIGDAKYSGQPQTEVKETLITTINQSEGIHADARLILSANGLRNVTDQVNKDTNRDATVRHQNVQTRSQIPTNRIRRAEGEVTVAFFATLISHQMHIGQGQNIKFGNVITNSGTAYDPHQGVFRAPVPGIYVFYTKLMTYGNDTASYGMYVNSRILTKLYVHGEENSYDGSANAVVVHMEQNDNLTVRHIDVDHGVLGDEYSSFSGFLLSRDDGQQAAIVGK